MSRFGLLAADSNSVAVACLGDSRHPCRLHASYDLGYARHAKGQRTGRSAVRISAESIGNQICARVCARDAAGQDARQETPRFGVDALRPLTEVSAATRDYARRLRRASYGS